MKEDTEGEAPVGFSKKRTNKQTKQQQKKQCRSLPDEQKHDSLSSTQLYTKDFFFYMGSASFPGSHAPSFQDINFVERGVLSGVYGDMHCT